MSPRLALVVALALGASMLGAPAGAAHAQSRAAFFDQPAELVRVGPEQAGERLPVVVFLQATNGTATSTFEAFQPAIPFTSYLAVLPAGAPASADYLPNFGAYVGWMEERVMLDLERARQAYPIDPERVYLVGFSLGGDTSWALLLRRPTVFRGAVVIGSRSSARPRGTTLRTLHERGCRVAFGIGRDDDAVRVRGITSAYELVHAAAIASDLVLYDGTHSMPRDTNVLSRLAAFVLGP